LSARRAPSTTLAPSLANSFALSSPIPDDAPVMIMFLLKHAVTIARTSEAAFALLRGLG
jgi:hypothetical protein